MFARILVPVDAGAGSQAAARVAARLARQHRARLHACYVVDQTLLRRQQALGAVRDELRARLEDEGRRALARVERACARLRVPCTATLREGDVAAEVLTAARGARVQLIVMSSSGRGPVASLLLGSHAQQILSRAPCPVLLIREGTGRRLGRRTR